MTTEYKITTVAGVECAWVPTGTAMSAEIEALSGDLNGAPSICGLCPLDHKSTRAACREIVDCYGFIIVEAKYIPVLRMRSKQLT